MKDTELRQMRDEAFYECYTRGLDSQPFRNLHEAAEWCINQPAPQFFISPKALVNYLGKIFRGESLDNLHESTRAKVYELYRRYLQYLECHPQTTLSRERICEELIDSPAPQFYIGHLLALQIIRGQRKEAIYKLDPWK